MGLGLGGYGSGSDSDNNDTKNSSSRKRKKASGLVGYGSGSGSSDNADDDDNEDEEEEETVDSDLDMKAPDSSPPPAVTMVTGEHGLPPRPVGKCPKKVEKAILQLIKHNKVKDVNDHVQSMKNFRNPSIYEKMIQAMDIDETASNSPNSLYNPKQWGEDDYYERLIELRSEHENKKSRARSNRTEITFERVVGTASSKITSSSSSFSSSSSNKPAGLQTRPPRPDQLQRSTGTKVPLLRPGQLTRPNPTIITNVPIIQTRPSAATIPIINPCPPADNKPNPSADAARLRAEVERKVKQFNAKLGLANKK